MANANNQQDAGLRPPGKAERLPSEGPSPRLQPYLNQRIRPNRDVADPRVSSDSSEGRHSAFPGGRKPAKWHGTRAGVAPSSSNHRTHLPHVEAGEVPQHVCFRLADSLPHAIRRQLVDRSGQRRTAPANAAWRRDVHAALDTSHGVCWLRRPDIAAFVRDACLHFHEERYLLHEWVIMPNHVHALFTPLVGTPLSSIVHSWKSHTARRINAALGRKGRVWASDYFDRAIRSERHFRIAADYIRANPVNASLCDSPEDWRWSSAYEPSVRDARPSWLLSGASSVPKPSARRNPRQRTMRSLHAS